MSSNKRTSAKRPRKRAKVENFDAGKMGRRLRAIPPSRVAINTQTRAYGRNVLARSRYLCANNPYAFSAKEEFIAYMVGTGITPNWQLADVAVKQAIQEAFLTWTDEADADGLTDFFGMQALIAGELFEAGEVFVRFRNRFASDGLSVPLQMQLLPSEMLPTDYNLVLPSGNRIECGIEFDRIGRRVGYWFYRQHPGEAFVNNAITANFEKVFVPASEVLHLYKPMRAGQIRGLPLTLSGMTTLAMLDLYDDAELERKRIAALFGAFVTRGLTQTDDDDANPLQGTTQHPHHPGSSNGQVDFSLEPGATVELDYGQDIKFAEPADVGGNYEAFQKRQLLRASAGMLATYHGMTGDTAGASFSTMRADQLRYRRRVEALQHHILVFQFCRRVSDRWMDAAVLAGAIENLNARDYVGSEKTFKKVKWTPPKWEWVDPLKDINAEKVAVEAGFKARSDVINALGEDPSETDARRKEDQDREKALGLNKPAPAAPGNQLPIESDDEEEDPPSPPQKEEDEDEANG